MANYLSKSANYGNYTQPINLDLVNFVMQSKQQKYDYSLAKLESKISDELGSIDLARTEDKEYFLNRAQQTLGGMGDISKLDFSQSNVSRQLDSRISSIVDDRVLNDVISTGNYRGFQNNIQQKQKENPELYSATNVAYAMEKQGVNSWLKGEDNKGNRADSLGTVTYEDYTDVGAELKDISENLDKYANVVKETTPDGLYFKTVEGEYLTSQEIQQIANQQLSSKAQRQMQINGWANYDGGNIEAQSRLTSNFKDFTEGKIANIDNLISKKKLELKSLGSIGGERKKALDVQIKNWEDSKRQTQDSYNSWMQNGNYDSMSSTLEKERVLTSFGDTFDFDNRGVQYSTNQVALSLQKLQMQAALKKSEGIGGIEGATVTSLGVLPGERDELSNTLKMGNEWSKKFNGAVNATFNKLPQEDQEAIMSNYNSSTGKTKEEHILEELERLPGDKVINQIDINILDEMKLQRDNHQGLYSEAIKEGVVRAESENLRRIVDELYDNDGVIFDGGIEMLDEHGNKISMAKYLSINGIGENEGSKLDLEENAPIKNQILKSYYADKILSRGALEGLNIFETFVSSLGRTIPNIKIDTETSEEDSIFMNRLIELSGSTEGAKKVLEDAETEGLYDTNRSSDFFGKATLGLTNLINRDNSVTDDNTINNWVNLDKIKTGASNFINEERLRPGKSRQALNIPIKSVVGQELMTVLSSGVNTISGGVAQFNINTDAGGFAIHESGADSVTISGRKKVKGGAFAPYEITVLKKNLPQSIQNAVEFETDAPIFDNTNMKPISGAVSFKDTNDRRAFLDATFFTGSQEAALQITKGGILGNLHSFYPQVMGSKIEPSIYGNAVTNMINSNNIFVKIDKEDDGNFYTEIVSKNLSSGVETSLFQDSNPIPEDMYDEAYRKVKRVPQIYVSGFVNELINQIQGNPENPSDAMLEILDIYGEQ